MQHVKRVLLVGSGRLAHHLAHWITLQSELTDNALSSANTTYSYWNRRQYTKSELSSLIHSVDVVWLAISDSQIVPFFEENLADHALQRRLHIVHFCGALYDPRMTTAHPLMSFPYELLTSKVYQKMHFTITIAPATAQDLSSEDLIASLLPGICFGSFSIIPAHQRGLYHALCVVAGNFPQLLWSEVVPEMQRLNVPVAALDAYISQIAHNFIALKENSLTGPLVRGDWNTLHENQRALELRNSKLKNIYERFVEVFKK